MQVQAPPSAPAGARVSRAGRLIPLALALGAMGLTFAQRPGKIVLDTRIELSADAGLFLHRVVAVWSPSGDLGHVQSFGEDANGELYILSDNGTVYRFAAQQ